MGGGVSGLWATKAAVVEGIAIGGGCTLLTALHCSLPTSLHGEVGRGEQANKLRTRCGRLKRRRAPWCCLHTDDVGRPGSEGEQGGQKSWAED